MAYNVVRFFLIIVEVMTALLLIGVILIQRSKSQGLGLAFGSGMGESLFGAQVGNVITRITVILAIVFLANTTLLAVMQSGRVEKASVTDEVMPVPVVPASALPSQQPPLQSQQPPLQSTGGMAATPPVSPLEAMVPESAAESGMPEVTDTPIPSAATTVDVPAATVEVVAPPVAMPESPGEASTQGEAAPAATAEAPAPPAAERVNAD